MENKYKMIMLIANLIAKEKVDMLKHPKRYQKGHKFKIKLFYELIDMIKATDKENIND